TTSGLADPDGPISAGWTVRARGLIGTVLGRFSRVGTSTTPMQQPPSQSNALPFVSGAMIAVEAVLDRPTPCHSARTLPKEKGTDHEPSRAIDCEGLCPIPKPEDGDPQPPEGALAGARGPGGPGSDVHDPVEHHGRPRGRLLGRGQ